MKKKDDEEYIPVEIWREARKFINEVTDDVGIYRKIRDLGSITQNDEADKFMVWWEFKRYVDFNHSLILLYENMDDINNKLGSYNVLDGFNQIQMKMVLMYRLLKENEMINE